MDAQFQVDSRVRIAAGPWSGRAGCVISAEWVEARYAQGWVYRVKLDEPIVYARGQIDVLVLNEGELEEPQ